MIRSVIDTNIVNSSLLKPGGNEAKIIDAIELGFIEACSSTEIIAQYHDVLFRPKFQAIWPAAKRLLALFNRVATVFTPAPSPVTSPDPGDTIFIACAFQAEADFLITDNARHFPEPFYGKTEVVNAAQLLIRLKQQA